PGPRPGGTARGGIGVVCRGRGGWRGPAGDGIPLAAAAAALADTLKTSAPAHAVRRGDRMTRPAGSGRAGLDGFDLPLNRLGETLAQHAQLPQLLLRQILVSIGQVEHGIVEPVLLVLRQGVDDAAAEDVAEHLVPGLGKRHRLGVTLGFLLAHAPSFWRRNSLWTRSAPHRNISGCTFWCKPSFFPGRSPHDYVYRHH